MLFSEGHEVSGSSREDLGQHPEVKVPSDGCFENVL